MIDNNKYLQCEACAEERSEQQLSIAVTPVGDLLILCAKHNVEPVAYIANDEIAQTLREVAGMGCQCATHKQETQH
jgi:hypothetical protein